jgi:hypothetical protein
MSFGLRVASSQLLLGKIKYQNGWFSLLLFIVIFVRTLKGPDLLDFGLSSLI